ncbi:hypothetical protein SAMN04488600_103213 [Paenibacillus polymyxa]|nr:hypothetical protein SAMN04488600_103213 [Paenibacillus polymyxa]
MFKRFKFCFRLYQGRSLETVCISFIFSFLVGLFLYLGHAPGFMVVNRHYGILLGLLSFNTNSPVATSSW